MCLVEIHDWYVSDAGGREARGTQAASAHGRGGVTATVGAPVERALGDPRLRTQCRQVQPAEALHVHTWAQVQEGY